MKIIYLADIHGAFAQVKELLAATDAQVYIIAGDLIDKPFFTEEMAARYRALQRSLCRLQVQLGPDSADMDDFVESLLKPSDMFPEISRDVLEHAAEYRDATVRARRVLQQKYKVLESILSLKSNSLVFCLPGNYDMDLQYTSLHGRDLHRHWYHAADLRIAGYGGADVATPGIPQRYCVPYRADRGGREMARFFTETRPDIIVTHKPAHGVHDHVAPMGESGSTELRMYCEENHVPLCLTGHIHDQWGFQEIDGTIYLNPSNFGEVHRPGGTVAEGGFFYSIDFQDRQVSTVTLCKLVRGVVHEVVTYAPRNERWVEKISDPERFGALLRGKTHDCEGKSGFTIRSEIMNKMKWFFPRTAVRHLINEITEKAGQAAFEIEKRYGASLSLDLLVEEDQQSSGANLPLDAVLYVRHSQVWPASREKHGGGLPPGVMRIINEINDKCPQISIIDCIDLDEVERALHEKDFECYAALLFAAYRAFGQTLAEGDASSVEEIFNSSRAFRGEIEGTGWAYMEIFQNVAARVQNMKLFEARLRELGITAPEAFKLKIREYLHGSVETKYKKAD
jgi:Icc-related predicted phosphoesterase